MAFMTRDKVKVAIAERLQRLREKKGASQGIGKSIPQQRISDWEKGEVPRQWLDLIALSEWYEVSADYIITLSDQPSVETHKPTLIPSFAVREVGATYDPTPLDELIWLAKNLSEEKQKAVVEMAKVLQGL